MTDDRAFFELAAALLPALMLAGLLSDRLKPPADPSEAPRWPFFVLLVVGTYFILAEAVAISAAISGEADSTDRVVVSGALIAAALSTVLLVLVPWIANIERSKRPFHIVAVGVVLLVLGVGSVRVLNSAIENASLQEAAEEFQVEADRHDEEGQRILAQQERLYEKQLRAERELSALGIRRANLLIGPPDANTRAKRFLLSQDIRSLQAQLKIYRNEQRRLTREFVTWAKEGNRLYGEVNDVVRD